VRWVALLRKELYSYFGTPVVYVVGGAFLALSGYRCYTELNQFVTFGFGVNILENFWAAYFAELASYLLWAVPLITMRLFAEERKLGTIELLLTLPLKDGEVIAAKFLSAIVVFGAILGCTASYPLIIYAFQPFDLEPMVARYLGLGLLTAASLACGMFISSLTDNQLVAAAATLVALVLLWLLTWNEAAIASSAVTMLAQLSTFTHYEMFTRGVIDIKDSVYFAFFVAFFLFLAKRMLEARRWKGKQ